jgi:hypothetical protein
MQSIGTSEFDVEELRARLRKMTDEELLRSGKNAAYMCSPWANMGKPPRETFVIQLRECRAEWRRRHPSGEHDFRCADESPIRSVPK